MKLARTGHRLAIAVLVTAPSWAQVTRLVSVDSNGVQGNGSSTLCSITPDGRYVVFASDASNLVSGDTNGVTDVFIRDRQSGTTERVSVDSAGIQGNGESHFPMVTPDGRFVAFYSSASNLVPGDTNGVVDVFVRDRRLGTTERVSVDSNGGQEDGDGGYLSISADGRFVAFDSFATNLVPGGTDGSRNVYVRDRQAGTTELADVDSSGNRGDGECEFPSISADGRYVAFYGTSDNLVPGDTNGVFDVFVRDRQLGTTERVSVDSSGIQANDQARYPSISADGRFVAFWSYATNLVPNDTNGVIDSFVRDRQNGTTERVSVDSSGAEGDYHSLYPRISTTGRYVVFESQASNLVPGDTNGTFDIFIRDRQTGTTERVSISSGGTEANGNSYHPGVSSDGRFVAFESDSSNMTADANSTSDIFVRDRSFPFGTRRTDRMSVNSSGAQGNGLSYFSSISADGRHVAFQSSASNLVVGDTNGVVDVFVRDLLTGTTERISVDSSGAQGNADSFWPSISADGRYVAFWSNASNLVPGDTNGVEDVFVRDRQAGTTERVSVDSSGAQGNNHSYFCSISADGRAIAFMSLASNLVAGDGNGTWDVYVRDRQTATTERVSVDSNGNGGNSDSGGPSISADGRYVAFHSASTNLVAGDTNGHYDVFLRDRQSGTTERVSVDSSGAQGDSDSYHSSISADGEHVAFESYATNLVAGDTNARGDVFRRNLESATTELVSVDSGGVQGNDHSGYDGWSSLSSDGRYVAFESFATNLVSGDTNGIGDVFVRDCLSGTTERVSVDSAGMQANDQSGQFGISISTDGRFVTFESVATNLVGGDTNGTRDVFVHDRNASGFTSLCEPGTGGVLACPCANPASGPGRGCDNSSATGGATLTASGIAYLSADSLVFTTSGEKPTAMSVLLQGASVVSSGVVYGRGVRCVAGALTPLFVKTAAGGCITAPDFGAGDPTLSARSSALGDVIQPGQSRWYFVFYRDANGACPRSTPGLMPEYHTFDATQTGRVDWSL